MAAIIGALDSYTSKQIGENGTTEYTWTNDVREKIVQLSFQLTRTKNISYLSRHFELLLTDLRNRHTSGKMITEEFVMYMTLLYKMIGHTRDIIDGKGEYMLSYMMLVVWHKFYPELAKLELTDYKVRILEGRLGTSAVTRVLIETSDGETQWNTVGVHENIIAASAMALEDAVTYGLLRQGRKPE